MAEGNNMVATPASVHDIGKNLEAVVTTMHTSGVLYDEGVREFRRRFLKRVLTENRGNQCRAARELGMHRNTLSRVLSQLFDAQEIAGFRPDRTIRRRPPQRVTVGGVIERRAA